MDHSNLNRSLSRQEFEEERAAYNKQRQDELNAAIKRAQKRIKLMNEMAALGACLVLLVEKMAQITPTEPPNND